MPEDTKVEVGVPVEAEPVKEVLVDDLARVELRPGDVLIARVDPDRVPRDGGGKLMLDRFVINPIRSAFPHVQIVILDKSIDLSVVEAPGRTLVPGDQA